MALNALDTWLLLPPAHRHCQRLGQQPWWVGQAWTALPPLPSDHPCRNDEVRRLPMDSFSLVAAPLIDADDLPAGKLHGVLVAEFVRQADDSHVGVRALDQVLDADAACRVRHAKQDLARELDPFRSM